MVENGSIFKKYCNKTHNDEFTRATRQGVQPIIITVVIIILFMFVQRWEAKETTNFGVEM